MLAESYIFGLNATSDQLLMNHEALEQTVSSRCKNYIQFLSGEVVAQSVRDWAEELKVLGGGRTRSPSEHCQGTSPPNANASVCHRSLNALALVYSKCSCVCQKRNSVLNCNFISISK